MAKITYDELIRRVPEWLYATNRRLVGEMENIVEEAHEQLINLIDHDLFRTRITGKMLMAADRGLIDLSQEDPRVLEVRAIRVKYRTEDDDFAPLFRRDLEMLTTLYARNRPAYPKYYAEYNGPLMLKVFPAPRSDMEIEVTANVEPELLTPTVQTNILTEQASRALEKATMRQAALFQKDWESAEMYKGEMMEAVTEVNAQIQRRRRDDTGQRVTETANVMGS